jgi:hypothetical protein
MVKQAVGSIERRRESPRLGAVHDRLATSNLLPLDEPTGTT